MLTLSFPIATEFQPYLSSFDEVVAVLTDFDDKNVIDVEDMGESTGPKLQTIINRHCKNNSVGDALCSLTTKLHKDNHKCTVPSTKEGLQALKVDETVASLLLQQVFGSTELVVGLHACKLVCALDLVDWEESGASLKQDVKMVKMPAE